MALNRMQNAKGAVLRLLENAYQNRDQACGSVPAGKVQDVARYSGGQVALIPCRGISAEAACFMLVVCEGDQRHPNTETG